MQRIISFTLLGGLDVDIIYTGNPADLRCIAVVTVVAANRLLVNALGAQDQLRFAMDYYEMMCIVLAGTLLLILCFPFLNRTAVYLKRRVLSPV